MSAVFGRFCPACGEPRPNLLTKRLHVAKQQRFQCRICEIVFTIHLSDETLAGGRTWIEGDDAPEGFDNDDS